MYELKQGSARLIGALYRRKEDPNTVQTLAHALNYRPEQLVQDIQALHDLYLQATLSEEISPERVEDLMSNWENERADDEWREDLTEKEAELVDSWDDSFSNAVESVRSCIWENEQRRNNGEP